MKKINIYNYEMFFLDFFEKELSPSDISDLFDFLDKHPELKMEFYDFENTKLHTNSFSYTNKHLLKVDEGIEASIIALLENDLNNKEREGLKNRIKENPIYKKEFQFYLKTILPPESVIYEKKESLKRKRSIVPFYVYGLAASIVLLFALFWFFDTNKNDFHQLSSKSIAFIEIDNKRESEIFSRETSPLVNSILIDEESTDIFVQKESEPINDLPILITELSPKSVSNLIVKNQEPLITSPSWHILNEISTPKEKVGIQYLNVLADISKSIFRKKTKDFLKNNSNLLSIDFAEIVIDGYNRLTDKDIRLDKVKDDSGRLLAFYLSTEDQRLFRYKKK